jgi:DivIVA domain-containing protein
MELSNVLNGKDVVSRSFATKARRGYDPREVDTFLDDVAMSLDLLHEQVATLELQVESQVSPSTLAPPAPAQPAIVEVAPDPAPESLEETPAQPAAERESIELVLLMAQKTAEEAIEQANSRSEELLADARFQAAQIGREADKKAFEAATAAKSELETVEREIAVRNHELGEIGTEMAVHRDRITGLAQELGLVADRFPKLGEPTKILDLTDSSEATNQNVNGHSERATIGDTPSTD